MDKQIEHMSSFFRSLGEGCSQWLGMGHKPAPSSWLSEQVLGKGGVDAQPRHELGADAMHTLASSGATKGRDRTGMRERWFGSTIIGRPGGISQAFVSMETLIVYLLGHIFAVRDFHRRLRAWGLTATLLR